MPTTAPAYAMNHLQWALVFVLASAFDVAATWHLYSIGALCELNPVASSLLSYGFGALAAYKAFWVILVISIVEWVRNRRPDFAYGVATFAILNVYALACWHLFLLLHLV